MSTAIPPLAVQEFSTFVHYCGLSVQTFIERGSVMRIPVLYSTNCNYHTQESATLESCKWSRARWKLIESRVVDPEGNLARPVCPSLNDDVVRQVRNTESGACRVTIR